MRRFLLFALALVSFVSAFAYPKEYNKSYRIILQDDGQEYSCSGTIVVKAEKDSETGYIVYQNLLINISDIVNYQWALYNREILDPSTLQFSVNKSTAFITIHQTDDTTFVFTVPKFYGDKKGTLRYTAILPSPKSGVSAEKAAADKANSMIGGSGTGFGSGSGTGFGTGSGSGSSSKGNSAGKGTSNGYNWSVSGRSLKGSLSTPFYGSNAEGTVVVSIRVNAAGQVVSATKGQGTNTSNQSLIDAAITAAKKATFSSGDGDVIGSITYTFKLK